MTFRLRPPAAGSQGIRGTEQEPCSVGKRQDHTRHVSESKNGVLQVGPTHELRSRDPGSQEGPGVKVLCPRDSFMSDGGVTAPAPHGVCSSAPPTAQRLCPRGPRRSGQRRDILPGAHNGLCHCSSSPHPKPWPIHWFSEWISDGSSLPLLNKDRNKKYLLAHINLQLTA